MSLSKRSAREVTVADPTGRRGFIRECLGLRVRSSAAPGIARLRVPGDAFPVDSAAPKVCRAEAGALVYLRPGVRRAAASRRERADGRAELFGPRQFREGRLEGSRWCGSNGMAVGSALMWPISPGDGREGDLSPPQRALCWRISTQMQPRTRARDLAVAPAALNRKNRKVGTSPMYRSANLR
jgi:hypothetical protein